MANASYSEAMAEVADVDAMAASLVSQSPNITRGDDISLVFRGVKDKVDALFVVSEGLVAANRIGIITHAVGARLPAIYNDRDDRACRPRHPIEREHGSIVFNHACKLGLEGIIANT